MWERDGSVCMLPLVQNAKFAMCFLFVSPAAGPSRQAITRTEEGSQTISVLRDVALSFDFAVWNPPPFLHTLKPAVH